MAQAPGPEVAAAFGLAVLVASAAGSAALLLARGWGAGRALLLDVASFALAVWLYGVVSLGPWSRDLGGICVVLMVAIRLAPGALAVVTGAARPWVSLIVAGGAYAALGAWLPVASLPFGDQVHYLLVADRLSGGSLDATLDAGRFTSLMGFPPTADDVATHVAQTPLGPRPVQGYAMPLLLLPGWALAGRLGAELTIALVAAWTSYQMLLILRDVVGERRVAAWTWVLASFLAPTVLLATHLYPNIVGAAIVATAYRAGFTAPVRRPAVAAALLALTLFLTPRNGLAFVVLLPFLLARSADRARVAIAAAVVGLTAAVANAVTFGLPIPYAGYAFGTGQAQELTQAGSITPTFWVGLPAMLFDRTFGVAGSASWMFIGVLGLVPALRARRELLLPAALTVGASVVALSFYRYWEGGYAPPARYFVDVLPLWAPFVAFGLVVAARSGVARAFSAVTIAFSALSTVILSGVPSLALNSAFDQKLPATLAAIFGVGPLGVLPSFQPVTPDWWVSAYLLLVLPIVLVMSLVLYGWRGTRPRGGHPRPEAGTPMDTPEPAASAARVPLLVFLVASLAALGVVLIGAYQPWLAADPDPVHLNLLRRWVPLSLALATVGVGLIGISAAAAERRRLYRSHFLLYAVPLLLMLMAYFQRDQLLTGQLGAVYMALGVGFAANALVALWRGVERLADGAAALRLAAVALVVFLAVWPYHRAVMPTASDEPHYLIVTESLLYDRDLDLRNDYDGDRYLAFYPTRLPDRHIIEVGAAQYPIRDLGLPIAAVVPFAIDGRLGVLAFMCAVGALLVAQLYLLLRDLRFSARLSLLAVATTALAHPLLTYTTQIYPELLTALALVSAARLARSGARTTLFQLALASLLVGTLPWLSTRAWPVAVGVGLVVAWAALSPLRSAARLPPSTVAVRALAGAVPFAALVLALCYVNWRMFGLFMPSAGYFIIREQQQVLTFAPQVGAAGLLFDRVFGLVPRAPLYLLAFVGAFGLWRRMRASHGAEIAALALGALLSFLYIADIAYWWADGSPPSRYLLASLPLLVAGVAAGWETLLALPRWRVAATAIAALSSAASFGVAYVYAVLPNLRYDLALDIKASGSSGALFSFLASALRLDPGRAFPSLVSIDPQSVALAVAWTAIGVALIVVGRRLGPRPA